MSIYADLLQAANFDAWESVQSALDKLPNSLPEHARWLVQHILETKLEYARLIAGALSRPNLPGNNLPALMNWEIEYVSGLSPDDLETQLQYGRRTIRVREIVSLNIRHSIWHAGPLAALLAR